MGGHRNGIAASSTAHGADISDIRSGPTIRSSASVITANDTHLTRASVNMRVATGPDRKHHYAAPPAAVTTRPARSMAVMFLGTQNVSTASSASRPIAARHSSPVTAPPARAFE